MQRGCSSEAAAYRELYARPDIESSSRRSLIDSATANSGHILPHAVDDETTVRASDTIAPAGGFVFVGHFAVGFAAKRVAPGVSLGTLILAAAFSDVLWILFVVTGIEQVVIQPGITVANSLVFGASQ